jgi:hypothetical protein
LKWNDTHTHKNETNKRNKTKKKRTTNKHREPSKFYGTADGNQKRQQVTEYQKEKKNKTTTTKNFVIVK